jgi:hypothetical protein
MMTLPPKSKNGCKALDPSPECRLEAGMRTLSLVLVLAIVMIAAALIASPAFIQGGGPGGPGGGPGFGGGAPPPAGKGARDRDDEGGGPRGGSRGVRPMFGAVTDEDIAQIMAFVNENMPWMKADLEKLRETDANHFRQFCLQLRFDIAQLQKLKDSDPEAFKNAIAERQLRHNAMELAAKVQAAADPKQRDALKEDLRKLVGQLFDVEIAARTAQIRQIETRLDALRKDMKDRVAAREDVVKMRVEEMLKGGKPEGPPPPLPPVDTPKTEPKP